jgi:hypothetical protein
MLMFWLLEIVPAMSTMLHDEKINDHNFIHALANFFPSNYPNHHQLLKTEKKINKFMSKREEAE